MDIGGTHISAALLDRGCGTVIEGSYKKGYVDSQASREAILKQWCHVLDEVLSACKRGSLIEILVSAPGPFDYGNGICLMDGMHKYQDLLNMDVRHYFSDRYNVKPERILFLNDAQSFLLGEVYHYRLLGKRVVGLTLGTGLGSAWYDGSTTEDLNFGSARFKSGISEDYISTRGLIRNLNELGIADVDNVKELVDSVGMDQQKQMVFERLTEDLSLFLLKYIVPLNPDLILLGGGIARANGLFVPPVQKQVAIRIQIASFNELSLFFGLTLHPKRDLTI